MDSNEEGKEDPKRVNILEKSILNNKLRKHVEEVEKVKEVQEAQVAKEVQEARFHLEVKEILQIAKETAWVEFKLQRAKIKVLQNEEVPSSIFMHAMAKAIKVL